LIGNQVHKNKQTPNIRARSNKLVCTYAAPIQSNSYKYVHTHIYILGNPYQLSQKTERVVNNFSHPNIIKMMGVACGETAARKRAVMGFWPEPVWVGTKRTQMSVTRLANLYQTEI